MIEVLLESGDNVLAVMVHGEVTHEDYSGVLIPRLEEIIDRHNKMPQQVRTLINSGAQAKNLTRFITTVSDTILKKLIEFTLKELGPPPAKFVFMILGSEGRNEQTLKTDQDNAIVYEDPKPGTEAAVNAYFLKFGEIACTLLDKVGVHLERFAVPGQTLLGSDDTIAPENTSRNATCRISRVLS